MDPEHDYRKPVFGISSKTVSGLLDFLAGLPNNPSCVYSESLGILDSYQYEEVSKTYLCGQYLTRLMSTVNNGY